MSDLFIGELLVLLLLLPVLLRPFFRRLQRIEGVSILPLISLLVCFLIVGGSGIRVSLLPVLLFSFVLFCSGFARLMRLFRGLPTDWYSLPSKVYSGLLLLVMIVVMQVSFRYIPELPYLPSSTVMHKTVTQTISSNVWARYTVWSPANDSPISSQANSPQRPVVLFSGGSVSGKRKTMALILAQNGWTVVAADFTSFSDYGNCLLSFPVARDFCSLLGHIVIGAPLFTNSDETKAALSANLSRLVFFARNTYGSDVSLYVVSEGDGCLPCLEFAAKNAKCFKGIVLLGSDDVDSTVSKKSLLSILRVSSSDMLAVSAGSYPVLFLKGDAKSLYGYGELSADDVYAAELLGSSRDVNRKQAELTAGRVVSWLSSRRSYCDHP
jgi:hypothetical protein